LKSGPFSSDFANQYRLSFRLKRVDWFVRQLFPVFVSL